MDAVVAFVVAFVVALIATPVVARVARSWNVVDHPGALKVHTRPVPYLGGVAVFLALVAGAGHDQPSWLAPMACALALGVVDDVRTITPRTRLTCEVAIGILAGLAVDGDSVLAVVVTMILVVVLVNAVNLLDGLDGLAAGVGIVSAIGLALLGGAGVPVALALAGALGGFLVFNRPPARIYLGDGGAYLIGVTLAMLVATALYGGTSAGYWLLAPLLVAVPLIDTAIAILRRRRAGRSVLAGDRSHVYDQLVDRGRTPERAVALCVGAQFVLVGAALIAWHLPPAGATLLAITAIGIVALGAYAGGFVTPGVHG